MQTLSARQTAGIIKNSDDLGILLENKKGVFYVPYTSIAKIMFLNIDKCK